jgi:hypothetical protein
MNRTMVTSHNVEHVVEVFARRGDWQRAMLALLGANRLGVFSTPRTYSAVMQCTAMQTASWAACSTVMALLSSTSAGRGRLARAAIAPLALSNVVEAYELCRHATFKPDVWSAAVVCWGLSQSNELVDGDRLNDIARRSCLWTLRLSAEMRAGVMNKLASCGHWETCVLLLHQVATIDERQRCARHVVHACSEAYVRGTINQEIRLWERALSLFREEIAWDQKARPTAQTSSAVALLLSVSSSLWPTALTLATRLIEQESTGSRHSTFAAASACFHAAEPTLTRKIISLVRSTSKEVALPSAFLRLLSTATTWNEALCTCAEFMNRGNTSITGTPANIADDVSALIPTDLPALQCLGLLQLTQRKCPEASRYLLARVLSRSTLSKATLRDIVKQTSNGYTGAHGSAELTIAIYDVSGDAHFALAALQNQNERDWLKIASSTTESRWRLGLSALTAVAQNVGATRELHSTLCRFAHRTGRWLDSCALAMSIGLTTVTAWHLGRVAVQHHAWAGALALSQAALVETSPLLHFLGSADGNDIPRALATVDGAEESFASLASPLDMEQVLAAVTLKLIDVLRSLPAQGADLQRLSHCRWLAKSARARVADCRAAMITAVEAKCVDEARQCLAIPVPLPREGYVLIGHALAALFSAHRHVDASRLLGDLSIRAGALPSFCYACVEVMRDVVPFLLRYIKDKKIKVAVLEAWSHATPADVSAAATAEIDYALSNLISSQSWAVGLILASRRLRLTGPALTRTMATAMLEALAQGRPDSVSWQAAVELVDATAMHPLSLSRQVAECFASRGQWSAAAAALERATWLATDQSKANVLLAAVNQRLALEATEDDTIASQIRVLIAAAIPARERRFRIATVVRGLQQQSKVTALHEALRLLLKQANPPMIQPALAARAASTVVRLGLRGDWLSAVELTQTTVDYVVAVTTQWDDWEKSSVMLEEHADITLAAPMVGSVLRRMIRATARAAGEQGSVRGVCSCLVFWQHVLRSLRGSGSMWDMSDEHSDPPYDALLAALTTSRLRGEDAVEVRRIIRATAEATHDATIQKMLQSMDETPLEADATADAIVEQDTFIERPFEISRKASTRVAALLRDERTAIAPEDARSAVGPWTSMNGFDELMQRPAFRKARIAEQRFLRGVRSEALQLEQSANFNRISTHTTVLTDDQAGPLEWGSRHGGEALAAGVLTECKNEPAAPLIAAYVLQRGTSMTETRQSLRYGPGIAMANHRGPVILASPDDEIVLQREDTSSQWKLTMQLFVAEHRRHHSQKPTLDKCVGLLQSNVPWAVALLGLGRVGLSSYHWMTALAVARHPGLKSCIKDITFEGAARHGLIMKRLKDSDDEALVLAQAIVAFTPNSVLAGEARLRIAR